MRYKPQKVSGQKRQPPPKKKPARRVGKARVKRVLPEDQEEIKIDEEAEEVHPPKKPSPKAPPKMSIDLIEIEKPQRKE